MKKLATLLTALACSAADWTCGGGQQKHETLLSVKSVSKLQLVVKRKLGNEPLSAPVMVGRLVTNKGIKDLVFIAGGSDVYAVDPDLATVFWQRHLAGASALMPVLAKSSAGDDDDDDNISMDVRALYLFQAHGGIATINAGSGTDIAVPQKVPADVRNCSRKARQVKKVIANGVTFSLTGGDRPKLYAFNTADGRELYRSGGEIEAPVSSSGMAIANGHVCFGDTKGTLYCFGFPVDL